MKLKKANIGRHKHKKSMNVDRSGVITIEIK